MANYTLDLTGDQVNAALKEVHNNTVIKKIAQTFTDAEKSQIRENIGAGSGTDVAAISEKIGNETLPTVEQTLTGAIAELDSDIEELGEKTVNGYAIKDNVELKANDIPFENIPSPEAGSLEEKIQDIDAELAEKANQDGFYHGMGVGNAEQLISPDGISDTPENDAENNPFTFRTSAGSQSISDGLANAKKIRGKSYKWNQLVQNGNFESTSGWAISGASVSVANNVLTATSTSSIVGGSIYEYRTSYKVGHKYLLSLKAKSDTEQVSFQSFGMTYKSFTVSTSQFTRVESIQTAVDSTNIFFPFGSSTSVAQGNTAQFKEFMCVDLTAIYGSGNEPTTVEDFLADYPMFNSYVPYTTGTVEGIKPTSLATVGFNQWDEEWEVGSISSTTGANIESTTRIRSKNYIRVIGGATYYIKWGSSGYPEIAYYDNEKNFITMEGQTANTTFIVPNNAHYIRFRSYTGLTTYNHDICINLSWSGYRNGEYESYWRESISTHIADYFANGMHGVGGVYDELTPTKAIKRFGIVNLGTLNWQYNISSYPTTPFFYASLPNVRNETMKLLCSKYRTVTTIYERTDKTISAAGYSGSRLINVFDFDYTNATSFRDAMAGVYLIYELATPVETPIDPPINFNYRISDFGTEEFVFASGDTVLPVPCELFYQDNLVDKLRGINDLTTAELAEVISALD